MHQATYKIRGMHCASCANIIERTFKKVEGVETVSANYGNESVKVNFDAEKTSPEALSKTLEPLGYSLILPQKEKRHTSHTMSASEMGMSEEEHVAHMGIGQSKEEKLIEIAGMRRIVLSLLPIAVFTILLMTWEIGGRFGWFPEIPEIWEEFFHHLLPLLALYTFVVAGKPYVLGLYRFFRYGKANMDTLVGLGTGAAFLYSFILSAFEESLRPFVNVEYMYYDVAIVVIAFITLGKYLEVQSKLKTGDAIEKLLNLQAKTALVMRDGKESEIPIEAVQKGEMIVVKPGARIPVDGVVREGSSYVDESMVTGEPEAVGKDVGEMVVAGTLNTTGSFVFEATKVGSETLLAQIIHMVEEAQGSKAPIQALADKISAVFVPIVIVIAFAALFAWLFFGTDTLGFAQALSFGLVSFVGVLVIACPCALGLATPIGIIVGVGKGAKEGILIKDAETLEKLHAVDTLVLDKTGTLTKGKPELLAIHSVGGKSEKEILSLLTGLEQKSEHPLAQAVLSSAKERGVQGLTPTTFEALKGKGVKGEMGGVMYYAGNATLMRELGIVFDEELITKEASQGRTPVFFSTQSELMAVVIIADALKPEAKEAIATLKRMGIRTVMLSGDDQRTAEAIGKEVGIDEVIAEVLPEQKLEKIKALQAEGKKVAMAGDGVNDAPALAQANVGIAMATGTDVAIETAGMTLLHGDISKLVKAIHLSRMTMTGIKQNLFWAFIYNIVGIPLAAGVFYPVFGWLLSPVFAGIAMAFSSVSVVGNALRIKGKRL